MTTPASIKKHPIHPMLVPFPIALWIFSLMCDLIFLLGWGGQFWNEMAFYTMAGGLIGALLAAIPGYLDFRSVANPDVRRIGRWHMLINLSIVILFAVNLWLRMTTALSSSLPLTLSIVGVGMLGVSGWLGGELVYVRGLAVQGERAPIDVKQRGRVA